MEYNTWFEETCSILNDYPEIYGKESHAQTYGPFNLITWKHIITAVY